MQVASNLDERNEVPSSKLACDFLPI